MSLAARQGYTASIMGCTGLFGAEVDRTPWLAVSALDARQNDTRNPRVEQTRVAHTRLWGGSSLGTNRARWFPTGERTPVDFAWASRSTSSANTRYRLEPAAKIRRSRYKSKTRGTTNTRPHQRPVAQITTTMTAIQTASSSRITSDDFRCRRSQFIVVLRYDQLASGCPTETRGAEVTGADRGSRQLSCGQSSAEQGDHAGQPLGVPGLTGTFQWR